MTYNVVVSVENSDLSLKPGMTTATVTESREEVTRVPDQALRRRPSNLSADPVLAAEVGRLRPGFLLSQNPDDPLFCEPARFMVHPLPR
jgi:HlyD family secretion protein